MFKKLVLAGLVLIFSAAGVWAQSAGDYQTKATGNWNAAATWEKYDGSSWAGSSTPTSSDGVITIRDGHTVTVTAAVTVDQVVIAAGGQVTLTGGTLTVANGTGDDFVIQGVYRRESTGTTMAINSGATVFCDDGGIYEHAIAGSGGTVPTARWHDNSVFRLAPTINISSPPTIDNQDFGIFEVACASQTSNHITLTPGNVKNKLLVKSTGSGSFQLLDLTIDGDYEQTGGTMKVRYSTGSSTATIKGNFTLSGGTFLISDQSGSSNTVTLNVDKDFNLLGGTFKFCYNTSSSVAPLKTKGDINLLGGSFDGYLVGASGFYLNGSGTQTVTNSLALGGVGGRFFYSTATGGPTGLNEIYNGTAAQNTISGTGASPATGYSAWATSGTLLKNLTINNANGVTLLTNKVVNEKLTLTNGAITLDGKTISYAATGSSLEYNGSSPQTTTNAEFPSANGPAKLIINNPTGVTLHDGRTLSGDLDLVAGVFDLDGKTLTVNGITTVTGGSFPATSTITTDGYVNGAQYLSIAENDVNMSSFSASTSVDEDQWIKRQWSISGDSGSSNKTITLSWTTADDNNYDWSGKVPSVFNGTDEYAGDTSGNSYIVSGSTRSITVSAPVGTSTTAWTIGLKGGEQPVPVVLSSFTVDFSIQGFASLHWVTQSETNVLGFYVYRSTDLGINSAELISPLIKATNTSTVQHYHYTDNELYNPGQYYYWLQNLDLGGSGDFFGPILFAYDLPGNSGGAPAIPLNTGIDNLFPNPFNPELNIGYCLENPANVDLYIYNQRGQRIFIKQLGYKQSGHQVYNWKGRNLDGELSSGIYFIELKIDGKSFLGKATLSK